MVLLLPWPERASWANLALEAAIFVANAEPFKSALLQRPIPIRSQRKILSAPASTLLAMLPVTRPP